MGPGTGAVSVPDSTVHTTGPGSPTWDGALKPLPDRQPVVAPQMGPPPYPISVKTGRFRDSAAVVGGPSSIDSWRKLEKGCHRNKDCERADNGRFARNRYVLRRDRTSGRVNSKGAAERAAGAA